MNWQTNRERCPAEWQEDIARSVGEYADWYLREAPIIWVEARERAIEEAERSMVVLDDFNGLTAEKLKAHPNVLRVIRMAISPKVARDRFVEFVGVKKNLVTTMERKGIIPARATGVEPELQRICDFTEPLLDPQLFPWIQDSRAPRPEERREALLVLGDRCAGAIYEPQMRNVQEARQKHLMREFLESNGLRESLEPAFKLPPGTFGFGRNVPIPRQDGSSRKLPCDCVVAPCDPSMPLACVEMKSAGDYTNVNKRRKEEAEKSQALARSYGDGVVFLLQLFGYFNAGYLSFEASEGIDWGWDHRLEDLGPYFGL
jgi:hypothetical protein